MSKDKEFEIQMQFLEEATDYLNTLESVLLEIEGSRGIAPEKINGALRAAHSIKGGAAMMGFRALSDLAHRLEDSFKVLKTRKNSLEIDTHLQNLLLSGVDWLRQIVELQREGSVTDEQWLTTFCYPVFDELHERLGDPSPEDANTMLSPEDGQDILPLLFETEVEGCLQRLEGVLSDANQPCLREEVSIMAAELGGLGEMLQLEPFTQLCESVSQYLDVAGDDRIEEVARVALQAWRRSQALVLIHQLDSLPTNIELDGLDITPTQVTPYEFAPFEELSDEEAIAQFLATSDENEEAIAQFLVTSNENEEAVAQFLATSNENENENEEAVAQFLATSNENENEETVAQFLATSNENENEETVAQFLATSDTTSPEFVLAEEAGVGNFVQGEALDDEIQLDDEVIAALFDSFDSTSENTVPIDVPVDVTNGAKVPATNVSKADYKSSERKVEAKVTASEREAGDNTVRVPSKQLENINDLFGELIIQRNGLNLQLERLRKLIRGLNQRVQVLERENQELRTAYDKISTGGSATSAISTLSYGDENNHDPRSFMSNDSFGNQTINTRFDALELDRYNDLNLLSQEVMETIVQVQEVTTDIQLSIDDTDLIARKLNKTSKQLQRKLTQVRMRPLSDIVDRFPRALRDLNVEYGKNAQLKIEGGGTLIERSILEALSEPLMHLLRNAFDHGIEDPQTRQANGKPEQATIQIKANHRSNRSIITISDDGRGISLEKIRARALSMGLDASLLSQATDEELLSLIFEPGFTTKDEVTALSGRGVGMDVVRNNLKQVRGDIKVDTRMGIGTTFTLSVPFTLSVARVLLVESNRMLLAFPTDVISEIFLLQNEQVFPMAGSEMLNWHGTMLPLIRLGRYLEFNCARYDNPDLETPPAINASSVLIINQGNQPVAIQVDRCWGEQEVAIRNVEGNIPLPNGFGNCTILGDGRVVALVNTNELLYWIASNERTPRNQKLPSSRLKTAFLNTVDDRPVASSKNQKGTILIVDDSINVRRFLALTLEKGGYQVEQAKDGQDALEKLQSGLFVQAVICDIEMPRLDGYGFLGRVKSKDELKNIPVTMLTSRSSDKHRQLAMQLGARAYFSKPYNEQELLRALDDMIFSTVEVVS
jgi:two-component system, chemotaxis family, sensor histidine kinase and response regulator PixL